MKLRWRHCLGQRQKPSLSMVHRSDVVFGPDMRTSFVDPIPVQLSGLTANQTMRLAAHVAVLARPVVTTAVERSNKNYRWQLAEHSAAVAQFASLQWKND
jgi:hypothetical protein